MQFFFNYSSPRKFDGLFEDVVGGPLAAAADDGTVVGGVETGFGRQKRTRLEGLDARRLTLLLG